MRQFWSHARLALAAFGAFLWVMLWWSRSPWLGVAQAVIIVILLFRELGSHLGGK